MHDIISLFRDEISAEKADELYRLAHVRAVAFTCFGSEYGAMVMSQTTSLTTDGLCLDPADCGIVIPLPIVPSPYLPGLYNVFAIVTLHGGIQARYAKFLRGSGKAGRGVKDARGLVLGMADVHAVIEVVGDNLTAVTNRLFELTDHEDVARVQTFVVPGESTRGFGVPLEDKPMVKPSRTVKKAAAKRTSSARAR